MGIERIRTGGLYVREGGDPSRPECVLDVYASGVVRIVSASGKPKGTPFHKQMSGERYAATRRDLLPEEYEAAVGVARPRFLSLNSRIVLGYVGDMRANGSPVVFFTRAQIEHPDLNFDKDANRLSVFDRAGHLIVSFTDYQGWHAFTASDVRRAARDMDVGFGYRRLKPNDGETESFICKYAPVRIMTEDGPVKAYPIMQDALRFERPTRAQMERFRERLREKRAAREAERGPEHGSETAVPKP